MFYQTQTARRPPICNALAAKWRRAADGTISPLSDVMGVHSAFFHKSFCKGEFDKKVCEVHAVAISVLFVDFSRRVREHLTVVQRRWRTLYRTTETWILLTIVSLMKCFVFGLRTLNERRFPSLGLYTSANFNFLSTLHCTIGSWTHRKY